uniref:Reverse transcriptase domain-containing protein n=1 Tax=Romanomermis culicivorax TaxID=13658 RepID=A0A915HWK0_ROMCU
MTRADLQTPHPWSPLYADDVFLADEEWQELQHQTQKWSNQLDENELRLNIKKTEYMECGLQTDGTINVSGEELKKMTQFRSMEQKSLNESVAIYKNRKKYSLDFKYCRVEDAIQNNENIRKFDGRGCGAKTQSKTWENPK